MGDKGFVKVLLGSYFCIILLINAVFAVGISRQMIYVFMVFYERYPSGQTLSGDTLGRTGVLGRHFLPDADQGMSLPMGGIPGRVGSVF